MLSNALNCHMFNWMFLYLLCRFFTREAISSAPRRQWHLLVRHHILMTNWGQQAHLPKENNGKSQVLQFQLSKTQQKYHICQWIHTAHGFKQKLFGTFSGWLLQVSCCLVESVLLLLESHFFRSGLDGNYLRYDSHADVLLFWCHTMTVYISYRLISTSLISLFLMFISYRPLWQMNENDIIQHHPIYDNDYGNWAWATTSLFFRGNDTGWARRNLRITGNLATNRPQH